MWLLCGQSRWCHHCCRLFTNCFTVVPQRQSVKTAVGAKIGRWRRTGFSVVKTMKKVAVRNWWIVSPVVLRAALLGRVQFLDKNKTNE